MWVATRPPRIEPPSIRNPPDSAETVPAIWGSGCIASAFMFGMMNMNADSMSPSAGIKTQNDGWPLPEIAMMTRNAAHRLSTISIRLSTVRTPKRTTALPFTSEATPKPMAVTPKTNGNHDRCPKISLTISSDDARYIVNTLCMKIDEIEYQSVGRLQKTFDSCQRFLLDRVVAVRQRATFPAVDATTTTALPTRVRMPRTLTARVKTQ